MSHEPYSVRAAGKLGSPQNKARFLSTARRRGPRRPFFFHSVLLPLNAAADFSARSTPRQDARRRERAPSASDHITAIRLPRCGAISSGSLAISSGSLIGHPHSNHYCNSECGAKQTPIYLAFLDAPEAER